MPETADPVQIPQTSAQSAASPPETASSTPTPPGAPPKKKKRPNKRRTRNLILAVLLLAVLAVGGYFLHRFLTQQGENTSEISTQPVSFGTIQNKASGWGSATVKDAASIVLPASGTVVDVYVSVGDTVATGDPLFTIFSQEVQDQIDAAEKSVEDQRENIRNLEKSITDHQNSIGELQNSIADLEGNIAEYQDNIAQLDGDIAAIEARKPDLIIRAPFAGKLLVDAEHPLSLEDNVEKNTTVATLVDDSRLKLSLYFSTAYLDEVKVGRNASVTIPAVMGTFQGKVEEVHDISYISPEGAAHFEAVISFENPGTLTEKMDASACLISADGTEIYPYSSGTTEFFERRAIKAKETGPVEAIGNLRNWANIREGEPLVTLGPDALDQEIEEVRKQQKEVEKQIDGVNDQIKGVYDQIDGVNDQIQSVRDQIVTENGRLEELIQDAEDMKKKLDDFNGVAPMDGTVTTCTLVPGEDVKSGDTVITIQDQSSMSVEITVDDRNIAFIQPGMTVELEATSGNTYIGTVESINMGGAQTENGMTNYPVTLTVDNSDGSLIAGMGMTYSFVTSESDECMMVPMQAVKYVSDENGETYSVVFIQADERPENAVDIELPEVMEGQTPDYPSPEDGFYPVPVETGPHRDTYNTEIVSGLNGDEIVFVQYLVTSFYG